MNISVENIDKVNAVITAVVEPADYTEKYEKALKDAKKKMNMPGFRPGMVPVGLIKKQFGVSLLAEEVNKILQEGLFGYIRENKINMLGEPLPTEENNNVELKEGESFTFKFDLAIAPEFEVSLTKKDKIDYYNVDVTDQMVANQVDMYRQRGGKYEKVDSYEDNDMIKGVITELDVENPVTAENVVMLPKYFKNDDQKKLFDGVKTNDIVTFNPSVAYNNNEAELTSLLKVEKEDALNHKGEFNFQITEITRFVPGPLDQELFDTVFPGGEVKTEADFRAKVKELIADQFKKDSDYKFLLDVRKHVTKKVGKLEFPEEKLKKILLANTGDQAKVDAQFEKSIEELTWHLIKEKLVEQNEVKVDDEDVKNMAKEVTRMQFAQYGMLNIPDEYLENSVKEMLKKRETVDNLIDRCIEVKLGVAIKEKVTLKESTVSAEDFNKMFEQ
ncbi:MAG: trigger factor [Bacteroidales bacterium]|jgi:trigger factor|nr:trigger factor [Bacteroidaceae bacterium]MDO4200771.1 trigger factor [Bacteroidales bacterium]